MDIHQGKIVACLLTPGPAGKPTRELKTCGAFTRDLLALADWLAENGCTHIAMESTGSYWKPIYNLFEGRFALLIVNARHLKLVPRRKTDIKDAEWIAELLRHGLLRSSSIPDKEQRELRELTRYRTSLVQERSAEVNRIRKVLEGANIKLGSVASNPMGVSGRAMLEAMVRAETDPVVLASLARGALRKKQDSLVLALTGLVGAHQRFLLAEQIGHIDELDARITRLEAEIDQRLGQDSDERDRLDGIPGVGKQVAEALLAEVGPTVDSFATADHLCSWAGVTPRMHESAGKNRSGRAPKGNRHLRTVLIQAAHAARPTKTFLGQLYRRFAARIGPARAALAVAHRILRIAYHILKDGESYRELGVNYHDDRVRALVEKRHTKALRNLGYHVSLVPTG
jgi:transposase